MIKSVIFDVGGVLLKYDPKTYLETIINNKDEREKVNKIIFHSKEFKEALIGKLTCNEVIDILGNENPKYKSKIKEILIYDNLKFMLPPIKESIEFFKQLKSQGYDLYILSNATEDTYNYIKSNYDIIQNCNGTVFSCFEGIKKPNEQIYLSLVNKYGINIKESIFIDDTIRNIDMANKIGFNCIKYDNLNQVKKEFEEILKRTK